MNFETLEAATVDQVWEALQKHVEPGRQREVPVDESLGCVLAADARSRQGFPTTHRAAVGGYALRVADVANGGLRLRVVSTLAGAGDPEDLAAGTCVRIVPGAPIPPGADAVVSAEDAHETDDHHLELKERPDVDQNINRAGSLIDADDLIVRAGSRIQAGTVAALVAGGIARIEAFVRPRVAQLTTSDALLEPFAEREDGQIHDSNSVLLEQLIQQTGGETVMFGRCPDDPPALRASLELGLANDLLCITGGMMTAAPTRVPELLEELGVRWMIKRIQVRPGRSTHIGRAASGCWVVGLPGNTVGCAVSFLLFARLLLFRLQGLSVSRPPHVLGTLEADLPAVGDRPVYHPAEWSTGPQGDPRAAPLLWRGSADPFGMAITNALIYRPAHAPATPRGETVQFVPLDLPR